MSHFNASVNIINTFCNNFKELFLNYLYKNASKRIVRIVTSKPIDPGINGLIFQLKLK